MADDVTGLLQRVTITDRAIEIVHQLKDKHGDLIFHLSGGCCDGSRPMLLAATDFYIDDNDVLMGQLAGVNFYMNKAQFQYWQHTFLTVDIVEDRGTSFSLEIPLGLQFIIHSRLLTEAELLGAQLK